MPVLFLCLHLSSLTLYLLIAIVFVINYGLECFINLDIDYIQLVLKRVHLLRFHYLSVILDPFAMDEAMEKAMLNCGLNVCDNNSMSMFEDCLNNELLELLKIKKHARIFVHMLKYLENEKHILHNSLCESNSLIKKYKRRNRIL